MEETTGSRQERAGRCADGWESRPRHTALSTAIGRSPHVIQITVKTEPAKPFRPDQASSKRSRFITLTQAATKSFTSFSFASAQA
jgi:hypothetical protein